MDCKLPHQLLTLHRLPQPLWPNLEKWFCERHLQSQCRLLPKPERSMPVIFINPKPCSGRQSCNLSSIVLCVLRVPGWCRCHSSLGLALVHKPIGLKESSSEQAAASICFSAFCKETESAHCPWCVTLPSASPEHCFFLQAPQSLHCVFLQECICSSAGAEW